MINRFLDRLFIVPRHIGFTGVILFATLYHLGSIVFGYSIAIVWLQIFLVAGSILAGLRLTMLLAVLISIYAYFAIPDLSRSLQIGIATLILGYLVGSYSRYRKYLFGQARDAGYRARENEEAAKVLLDINGNLERVRQSRIDVQSVLFNFADLPDSAKIQLRGTVHTLGNLEQAVSGWMALHEIKEGILDNKLTIGERIRRSRRGPDDNLLD